ncbi:MAG: arginine--tRNA ligase [Myxococcales bacterium]|nr:arginine--tRNA ligase [Myxococcales bacterium]
MFLERHLATIAAQTLQEALGLDETPNALLRSTQDPKFGDYQINGAIALAKKLGRPPHELAAKVAEALKARPEIADASVAGPGFVNLTLDAAWLGRLASDALADERLGVPSLTEGETIVVDFSSPNIAKQMHVGHLRSTIIGAAIVKLLRFVGHEVVGDNHLGDWGTQFGLLIVGMRSFGDAAALEADAISELERVYRLASDRAKADEDFAASARAELAKLQAGDPESRALWERFVATTRGALDRSYARLGVSFDEWLGESFYDPMLAGVVQELLDAGIAREDDGAICIFWGEIPKERVPAGEEKRFAKLAKQKEPFIIRKKDGAFLYSTSDLATLKYRRDHFRADRSVYVVDARQALHFEQVFAAAILLGYAGADADGRPVARMQLQHVHFGTVLGDDGKPIKTRDGKAVTLASLLDEAEERALALIREKAGEGSLRIPEAEWEEAARVIGVGAVKYADLAQNRASDYRFDWDKLISFKGNASPYLQYMVARCRSIFENAAGDLRLESFSADVRPEHPAELALVRLLVRWPDVVERAAEDYLPHYVCEHLYELASAFSGFYTECKVLVDDEPVRESRLALTALTAKQLELGLALLGIGTIAKM